jgi:hypothetical protein
MLLRVYTLLTTLLALLFLAGRSHVWANSHVDSFSRYTSKYYIT